ncbi:MAG: hypothetical protein IKR50_01870 [Prevotella sp.]|nr:hypothetical protein [Prevotella sp.]
MNHALRWLNRLTYLGVDMEAIRFNPLEDVEYFLKHPDGGHLHQGRQQVGARCGIPLG